MPAGYSISVTPAGRALLARAPAAAQERLLAGLGLMGAGSRRQLADLLGRLVDLMALPDRSPPMFFEPAPRGRDGDKIGKSVGGTGKKRSARLV